MKEGNGNENKESVPMLWKSTADLSPSWLPHSDIMLELIFPSFSFITVQNHLFP